MVKKLAVLVQEFSCIVLLLKKKNSVVDLELVGSVIFADACLGSLTLTPH